VFKIVCCFTHRILKKKDKFINIFIFDGVEKGVLLKKIEKN